MFTVDIEDFTRILKKKSLNLLSGKFKSFVIGRHLQLIGKFYICHPVQNVPRTETKDPF